MDSKTSQTNPSRFTVYYDHSCPMCRREITFYQRRAGADNIDWIDVSDVTNAQQDISCQQAMARFHVRTREGRLVDGGEAFAELWKQLPAFHWIGAVFLLPPFKWILNFAYRVLLPLRPHLQGLFLKRSPPKDSIK